MSDRERRASEDRDDAASTMLAHDSPPNEPSSTYVPAVLRAVDTRGIGVGTPNDRYRMGALLGAGGMGTVHLYSDRRIGREVALKRMHEHVEHGGETRARFLREARVQGPLEHPSIVPVYDVDVSPDGELYFTMRRVQGKTLANVLHDLARGDSSSREQWSQRKLLSAFVQVCLAVHYAHSKGVVHRDLKPGNIMLGDFGEVYVLDWGLARISDDEAPSLSGPSPSHAIDVPLDADPSHRTRVGAMLGTPMYMSPEQFRGDADVDERTDIFALGLTLFEILTLQPYRRGNFETIRLAAMVGAAAHPCRIVPTTPPELDALCARATTPAVEERLASARELAVALEQFLDGERDLEQRRALAERSALRAHEALEASEHATSDERREELHTAAMRDVVSALALDERQPEARRTMVRLLTEAPASLPAAVQRELEDDRDAARQRGLRLARWAWLSWLVTAPVVLSLGVRSMLAFAMMCLLVTVGTALCFEAARRPRLDRLRAFGLATVTAGLVSGVSMWLGPFVLLPVVASSLLTLIMSHSRPNERRALLAIAVAVVVTPLALEWLGVVAPSYAFVDGQLRLLPRAMELRPGPTLAMLLWSTLGFVLVPSHLLTRLRDQLDAAQERLALQSWQLRQLGREAAH